MKEHELRSHPPEPKSREELEKERQRFILGDSEEEKKKVQDEIYPWEAPYVRKDVRKLFSLRFTEPEMLKLQYIHQKTGKSMHRICMEVVLPAIEKAIKDLTTE